MTEEHPDSDRLELYILNRLSASERTMIENHVLLCFECAQRLEDLRVYVRAMQDALSQLRSRDTTE